MPSCRRVLFVVALSFAGVGAVFGGTGAAPASAEMGWTLAGRVVEPSGKGVAGRSVIVRCLLDADDGEDRSDPAVWRTTTDSTGRFVMTVDRPGLVEVRVGSPRGHRLGPLPVVRSIVLPTLVLGEGPFAAESDPTTEIGQGHEVLDWRVGSVTRRPATHHAATASRPIRGRVIDAHDGQPIAGALVWSGSDAGQTTRSRADGRFVVELVDDVATFDVAAVGHLWRQVDVPKPSEPVDLSVPLDPTIRGVGEVRDLEDRPIAGAAVRIAARSIATASRDVALGLLAEPLRVHTDRAGRFVVDDLPPTWLDLVASADGFASFAVPGVRLAVPDAPETSADLGVLTLDRGVPWRARLVDVEGEPLTEVVARHRRVGVDTTWSDGLAGSIRLEGLTEGRRFDLDVRADGYRPAVVSVVPSRDDRTRSVVLTPMRSVRGHVVDASGSAISARVEILAGDLAGGPRRIETSPDGRFEISAAGGRLVLAASRRGHGTSEPRVVRVGADAGPVDAVRLRLRDEVILDGRVVAPTGEPVAGAELVAELVAEERAGDRGKGSMPVATATSEADGSFRLVGLADGVVRVTADHPDFGSVERSVDLGASRGVVASARTADLDTAGPSEPIELAYPSGWPLVGRVTDRLGRPIRAARLRLQSSSHGARHGGVDLAGAFAFRNVPRGEYRLSVEADGFATPPARTLEIGDEPPPPVDLVVETGVTVWAQVRGLDVEQLAEVEVEARARHGVVSAARPDHRGLARIGPLAAGEWTLTALVDDGRRRAVTLVEVPPMDDGRPVDAELDFGHGVRLAGRIRTRRQPVPGARLLLSPGRGASIATATDAEGRFGLDGLVPGVYRLEVVSPALAARTARVIELVTDQRLDVDLDVGLDDDDMDDDDLDDVD